LLDTLVNPAGVPISPAAYAVHGIRGEDLVHAPSWDKVLPKLRKATRGRVILAYNAEFDRSVILRDTARAGRKPMHLANTSTWGCVMNRRSDWLRTSRWLRLGGGHRALGDCHSAREVLLDIARLPELRAA
jgi:DNA polymerase III epsilon subunit-like protein